MNDRGEYRPIYESLWDGPDFQALTSEARLVLLALKGKLGCAGIKAVPGLIGALTEWTGYDEDTIRAAMTELIGTGWIERDRNIVWVVRGLEFEPTMNPANDPHQKHIQRVVDGLPRLSVVSRFCARYKQWSLKAPAIPLEGPSNGPAGAMVSTTTTTSPSTTTVPNTSYSGRAAREEPTDGQVLGHERATLWIPDGTPPADWSEARSITVYREQRAKGATGWDLLAAIDGLAELWRRGDPDWLRKRGKACIRAVNRTYNGVRPMWDVALEASRERAPPKAKRGQPTGIADIKVELGGAA